MKGQCKLYGVESDLQGSHIYPSFVIKFMKKTGGANYIRNVSMPDKREQDGIKRYWLSRQAEQKFGLREKWFNENIFLPYMKNKQMHFDYDEKLFYFGISFLWRILHISFEDSKIISQPFFDTLKHVENDWRFFLINESESLKFNKLNLFLTNRVKNHTIEAKGIDYYLTRAADGTVIWTSDYSYIAVYGKFLRFIFWSVIKDTNETETIESRINITKGKLSYIPILDNKNIYDWVEYRAKELMSLPKISEKQKQKVINDLINNYTANMRSDAVIAKFNDEINLDK